MGALVLSPFLGTGYCEGVGSLSLSVFPHSRRVPKGGQQTNFFPLEDVIFFNKTKKEWDYQYRRNLSSKHNELVLVE
jgi:hypothetical protein